MIVWSNFILGIISGIISGSIGGLISFVIFWKYFMPKLTARSMTDAVKALQKDPEISPLIDKGKKIVEKLEPFVEKLKTIDLEKINNDLKPLVESLKKIDPETVEDLLKTLKELADNFRQKLEKPKIPKPD